MKGNNTNDQLIAFTYLVVYCWDHTETTDFPQNDNYSPIKQIYRHSFISFLLVIQLILYYC